MYGIPLALAAAVQHKRRLQGSQVHAGAVWPGTPGHPVASTAAHVASLQVRVPAQLFRTCTQPIKHRRGFPACASRVSICDNCPLRIVACHALLSPGASRCRTSLRWLGRKLACVWFARHCAARVEQASLRRGHPTSCSSRPAFSGAARLRLPTALLRAR